MLDCRWKTKIYLYNKNKLLALCTNIEQRSVLLQEGLGVSMYVINYNGGGLRLKSSILPNTKCILGSW